MKGKDLIKFVNDNNLEDTDCMATITCNNLVGAFDFKDRISMQCDDNVFFLEVEKKFKNMDVKYAPTIINSTKNKKRGGRSHP